MSTSFYKKTDPEILTIRDHLAIDRTVLANERTFLGYIRTALACLAAGASFVQFFGALSLTIMGWCLIILACMVLVVGITRFYIVRESIKQATEEH